MRIPGHKERLWHCRRSNSAYPAKSVFLPNTALQHAIAVLKAGKVFDECGHGDICDDGIVSVNVGVRG